MEKPIGVNVIGGLWIVIGIGVGVSLPIYFIYRKYRRIGEEDEEEKSDEEEGKFDNSQAAEIDLMTKFE